MSILQRWALQWTNLEFAKLIIIEHVLWDSNNGTTKRVDIFLLCSFCWFAALCVICSKWLHWRMKQMNDSLMIKNSFNFDLIHRIHHSYLVSQCANQHVCMQNVNHSDGTKHTAYNTYALLKIELCLNMRVNLFHLFGTQNSH